MAKVTILGSSNAIPDAQHENTHLAIRGHKSTILVDCAGNPIVRLKQAGVDLNHLTDLILTHFHPDHVSGVPLLLMGMWLLGRKHSLNIYGLPYTLDRIEATMDLYEWKRWPNFFPVAFRRLSEREKTPVLETEEFRLISSPVRHLIPTIGLRVEFSGSNKVLAYSCDTEPCPAVIELAAGADVLIHEATGASPGHSSPAQAAEIARQAEVSRLYLIHYPTGGVDPIPLVEEARRAFAGQVGLAEDFMVLEF